MKQSASVTSRTYSASLSSLELATAAIKCSIERKAHDVAGLDVSAVSDIADYFVLASGNSDRHVRGIADKIQEDLKTLGESTASVSGYESADWVILDYGNVLIHVFLEPARHHYNLDELWSAGRTIALPPELEKQTRQSRTGLVTSHS